MTESTETMPIEQSPPSPSTEDAAIHSIEDKNSQKTEVDSIAVGGNNQTDGIGGASGMDIVAKDSDVRLSTNADHMENALVNDYTKAFTTYRLFNSREALVDWVREVGKENGFMIVIKSSEAGGGKNNRRPRVRFACERSGKYRKFVKKSIPVEEVKQRPDYTSTKKCGCPFELKAVCDHEGWTLTVMNGMHNHLPARNLERHSYAGRLSSEEAKILVEMSKSLSRPRDILNSLKNRDPTNMSTIKSIYNARQKYRAIERAVQET